MFLKRVTTCVDLEDSGLVKPPAQNILLYIASITERKPVMTTWEIQVYKKREQYHIYLYMKETAWKM
jgi:hypothetical protein